MSKALGTQEQIKIVQEQNAILKFPKRARAYKLGIEPQLYIGTTMTYSSHRAKGPNLRGEYMQII
jgi:hypothetical protein